MTQTLLGNVHTESIEGKMDTKNREDEHPLHTFTTLGMRKITKHTLLSITYLDKQNTFKMFNLAQNHIHNRSVLHCASGSDSPQ